MGSVQTIVLSYFIIYVLMFRLLHNPVSWKGSRVDMSVISYWLLPLVSFCCTKSLSASCI